MVKAVPTDVSAADQVRAFFARVKDGFGRIDVLVNNAGIGRSELIAESTEVEWDQVQAINLKGTFLCTKAIRPVRKRQRSGYIVNMASLAGKIGFGCAAAYSASKFGVVGLTESLLEEAIAHNIEPPQSVLGTLPPPWSGGPRFPSRR